MDVSVIIVTYNTLELTRNCIESVMTQTKGIDYEIILVDNGSIDGSKEYFVNDTRIKYIYSEENLGFGKANNLGRKYANGKYLLFLNSDTPLISNALLEFYECMESNPQIAVLGGQLLWPDGTLQESFSIFPSLFLILKDCLGFARHTPKEIESNGPVMLNNKYISGADLFISLELFKEFEGFCTKFFMYYEETDLQYRIKDRKLGIAFNPNIQIIHYNGGSLKKISIIERERYFQKIAVYNRSRILYFRLNHPKKLLILRCILTIGMLLRYKRISIGFSTLIKEIWSL